MIAVALIGFFAFYEVQGQPMGLAMWKLFGSTNQILGGLTLLTITIYLRQRGANYWYTAVPMAFMLTVTIAAMLYELNNYWNGAQHLLLFVAASIFTLSVWLVIEAVLRFRRDTAVAPVAEAVEGD